MVIVYEKFNPTMNIIQNYRGLVINLNQKDLTSLYHLTEDPHKYSIRKHRVLAFNIHSGT